MNVLVIPEDFRKDQFVLKPIVEAMMKAGGRRAKVQVCTDPLLGGIDQALRWERIKEVVLRYPMVDLFLLCVDRDGVEGRRASLDSIENRALELLSGMRSLFAENAWQEIEVWVLAGHELPSDWKWRTVREDLNPKENYFIPFSKRRGLLDTPAEGRGILAREAARNYNRICQLCPEVGNIDRAVLNFLEQRGSL